MTWYGGKLSRGQDKLGHLPEVLTITRLILMTSQQYFSHTRTGLPGLKGFNQIGLTVFNLQSKQKLHLIMLRGII